MAFQTLALLPGREAASILELDLDSCENVYGTSPCTATLGLTNALRESQTFDVGATWAPFQAAVVANAADAPDGTTTADELRPDDVVVEVKELTQPINLTLLNLTDTFTYSIYAKAAEIEAVRIYIRTNAIDGAYVDVNLTNGTVLDFGDLGAGAPIVGAPLLQNAFAPPGTQVGLEGWFRISLSFTFASLTVPQARVALLDPTGTASFAAAITDGLLLWGAQIREGATAGLYAPTTVAIVNGLGTSDDLCYNTFGTCQDTPNYIKEVKTYRFISERAVPIEISDAYPVLGNVSYAPTRLDPGAGFSARGTVQVELRDFQHNDIGGPVAASQNAVDKYVRLRSIDVDNAGTFFGRLKARNAFYVGRPMRILEGYIDEPFSLTNFRTREYVIEKIEGPNAQGMVRIIGKDILALARNDRAQAPVPSVGTVAVAVTVGAGTITVSAGDGPDYDVDSHIRIDDEIILIVSRLVDVLTVTRAQGGTLPATHAIGAGIQSCLTYDDTPVIDVIQNLIEDFANIPSSFVPFTDWEDEETASLSGYDLTTIISEPTGVTQLLKEISDSTLIDLWYSDVDQEIKLKLQTPFEDVTLNLNDANNLVADSMDVRDVLEKRLTRILIYYEMRNFAENLSETANFSRINFEIDADKEGVNKFNDQRVKVIFSRWFDASNATQVALTSQRLLERFGGTPQLVTFDLDAKDVETIQTGDVFDLETRVLQAIDGRDRLTRFQVTESQPREPGSIYRYKALSFFADPAAQGPTVISASQTDVDLFVELGGPPGPVTATITINAAVIIDATQGNPALTTGALHPDSEITIINNGEIHGHSGGGGNGGSANTDCSFEGEFPPPHLFYVTNEGPGDGGDNGGDAINVTVSTLEIDNTSGNIFGAGGGGGGGRGAAGTITVYGGHGGGGGRGSDGVGEAGIGGSAVFFNAGCPAATVTPGNAGGDGSPAGAGLGATGAPNFDGGDGSTWGTAGIAAPSGATGGGGGFAVRLNGNVVVWLGGNVPAQVMGTVG